MSSAVVDQSIDVPRLEAPVSAAFRNLLITFSLAVSSLAIAGWAGKTVGYETLIVAMGWPHILLGFVFYFGKVVRGEAGSRKTFLLLVMVTLALWAAHYSWFITGFVSLYFTYHVFRDEIFIYFQTRSRHKFRGTVYVAGLIPFILLMFLLTDPRPQHYRQDLRRVEIAKSQLLPNAWNLIPFKPISYSKDQPFYFYLELPRGSGLTTSNLLATTEDSRKNGEIRIADREWQTASDLVFRPSFSGDDETPSADRPTGTIHVPLSGDYRTGQTFVAERGDLNGIWILTPANDGAPLQTPVSFHLTTDTSVPFPPLAPELQMLRKWLVLALLAIALTNISRAFTKNRAFWIYFLVFITGFTVLQMGIKKLGDGALDMPVMFQLVVVFHYWSWYVFSFDKLRNANRAVSRQIRASSLYDRMLLFMQSTRNFTIVVVMLNVISAAGVLWYTKFDAPQSLRFVFDYSYFLYFLILHVTFSFNPRGELKRMRNGFLVGPAV